MTQVVEDSKDLDKIENNKIIGTLKLNNSKIRFNGTGNILVCEEEGAGVVLNNSCLEFNGDNSIIYLSSNRNSYLLNISIYNNSVFYIGRNNYINQPLNIIISEQQNVILGNDGLYSIQVWVRTADPHLVYDGATKKRINTSRGVFIGDHVWVGQNVFLLKGTQIGSGSIIGANSLVAGKMVESNASYGGNPAKCLKQGIFWLGNCVHKWRDKETKQYKSCEKDEFMYEYVEDEVLSFTKLDQEIKKKKTASEKLEYIEKNLVERQDKNRFYIKPKVVKKRFLFF